MTGVWKMAISIVQAIDMLIGYHSKERTRWTLAHLYAGLACAT